VAGGGEPGHVGADLGDDDRGRGRSDPGDLVEPGDRVIERGQVLGDLCVQVREIRAGLIDMRQHSGQQEPVMLTEGADLQPGEGFLEEADLGTHP
jgi:hypothetical protein